MLRITVQDYVMLVIYRLRAMDCKTNHSGALQVTQHVSYIKSQRTVLNELNCIIINNIRGLNIYSIICKLHYQHRQSAFLAFYLQSLQLYYHPITNSMIHRHLKTSALLKLELCSRPGSCHCIINVVH